MIALRFHIIELSHYLEHNYFLRIFIMNKTQKTIALAIGGAFALSIVPTSVNAASNPFTAKSLSSGYQVADAEMKTDMKAKDGKCSTGKCGANK